MNLKQQSVNLICLFFSNLAVQLLPGWVLKQCPYYDILDEVMGCRPNVSPPAIVSTSRVQVEDGQSPGNRVAEDETGIGSDIENADEEDMPDVDMHTDDLPRDSPINLQVFQNIRNRHRL